MVTGVQTCALPICHGDTEAHLKVILETGLLKSAENIKIASILSMYSGADFIKTSTGKIYAGATPEAAYVMCQCLYICIIALLFKAFKNIFICKYKKKLWWAMLGTFTKGFLLSFLIEVTQTYVLSFFTSKKRIPQPRDSQAVSRSDRI